MNHLEAAEVIARMLYDENRKFAFSKEQMTALDFAIRAMRYLAKEKKNVGPLWHCESGEKQVEATENEKEERALLSDDIAKEIESVEMWLSRAKANGLDRAVRELMDELKRIKECIAEHGERKDSERVKVSRRMRTGV